MTLPPRAGSDGTSMTASTSAWAVWMTRGMRRVCRGGGRRSPARRGGGRTRGGQWLREGPPGSHWPPLADVHRASPATVLVHRLAARPPRSLPPRQHPGMAARRTSLPEELSPGAFTVARAHQLSVTRGRLRSSDLEAPTRGVRRPASDELDLVAHASAFAAALPTDAAFSHTTAARLHRLPTPAPWPGSAEALDVMRATGRPRVSRSGCVPHRGSETRTVVVVSALRATSPVDTWCDLAGHWAQRRPPRSGRRPAAPQAPSPRRSSSPRPPPGPDAAAWATS